MSSSKVVAFDQAACCSAEKIMLALDAIAEEHSAEEWHAALAVYIGAALRIARRNNGMSKKTAELLIESIRNFALDDEPLAAFSGVSLNRLAAQR